MLWTLNDQINLDYEAISNYKENKNEKIEDIFLLMQNFESFLDQAKNKNWILFEEEIHSLHSTGWQ